jgi:hypothetical protein
VDLATATERELLIHLIRSTHRMEALMSNLDDAVTAIADSVATEVTALRAKLAAAQADDAAAADVAVDVEENVAKLEAIASGLRDGSFPAAGTDAPPSDVPA